MRSAPWLVAVDVGGTFTDAVAVTPESATLVAKVPSTPDDPAVAVERAIGDLQAQGLPAGNVELVFHGTTVATNAVLTGRLARVALAATEGFTDIMSYRDGTRPSVYDLTQPRPEEIVRRRDRVAVRERVTSCGERLVALDGAEIERVVEAVARLDPEAVAVALLFSYLDDHHERLLVEALERRLPGIPVTGSAQVAREFREYPRTATAVVNASLRPVVGRYLVDTEKRIREGGLRGRLMIMQSNGGCVPAHRAADEAHRLLLSGPAAGVAGAVALGRQYGIDRLISFDMGGTSLDVCLVADGVPPVTSTERVASHPLLCPSVDMVTIGAGGGSIAELAPGGRLVVGPRSAGADPGPAAYGQGGKQATLTDAHVVLGTLPADLPLAGGLHLDVDAARMAIGGVADGLNLSVEDGADGIVRVAVAHTSLAVRRVSVERGIDPTGFTLVAFGGAGPLHAGLLLRELQFSSVLVPRYPGLFAAAGLVSTDVRVDESRTVLTTLGPGVAADVAAWLRTTASAATARLRGDGIPRGAIRVTASVDCRYVGQGYELSVPVSSLTVAGLRELPERFADLHERTYGHRDPTGRVELVTVRLSAFGGLPRARAEHIAAAGRLTVARTVVAHRLVRFPGWPRRRDVPVYDRSALRAGHRLPGPAVVHQRDATTLVLDGQQARTDRQGSLWIEEQR